MNAALQKAEYIWADGREGAVDKGVIFNEMRSKTKVRDPSVAPEPQGWLVS